MYWANKMINHKKILAIIPARGGSKGLPRKNVLDLGGMPLISWTIKAAQNSKYIDRVILSSDDSEICAVARDYKCDVPFIRPDELASDTADSASVVLHALEQVGDGYDIVILLQATSPFRNEKNIDAALEQFVYNDKRSLVSVAQLNKSPEWLFELNSSANTLSPLYQGDKVVTRRQDSRHAYYLNGAIYIFDKQYFISHRKFIDEHTLAYVMETSSSIDIDSIEDLNYARFKLENAYHD